MERELSANYVLTIKIKAEAPILWPPDAKSRFIGKNPDDGKE